MKTKKLLLTALIGAGLASGVAAEVGQQPGEMVQMKSLLPPFNRQYTKRQPAERSFG
jgi:hypothetical protein